MKIEYYRVDDTHWENFRAFMRKTVGDPYCILGYPCWRVGNVLITQWGGTVKIYYEGGRKAHWFDVHCERLRKAVMRLSGTPQPKR